MALVLESLGSAFERTAVLRMSLVLGILMAGDVAEAHRSVVRYADTQTQVLEMRTATVSGGADLMEMVDHDVHTLNVHTVAVLVVAAIVVVGTSVVRPAVAKLVLHPQNDLDTDAAAAAAAAVGIGLTVAVTDEVSAIVAGIDQSWGVRIEVGGALDVAHSVGHVEEAETALAAGHYDIPVRTVVAAT
jgi:hypothetical protein